ncbi:MAG: hypothetical protein ACK4G5_15225, partial [Devosia sp.]
EPAISQVTANSPPKVFFSDIAYPPRNILALPPMVGLACGLPILENGGSEPRSRQDLVIFAYLAS